MATTKTTATYSLARDLRRFTVEALCLLMLFYGAPLQALEETVEPIAFSEESGATGDPNGSSVDLSNIANKVAEWVEPVVIGAQTSAEAIQQGVGEMTSQVVHQPWGDALTMMLTASSLGLTQAPSAPPSPPADPDRPSKNHDLESLAAGFPGAASADKSALDSVPLLPGWNQVSLPEVPADSNPATVLAAIGGSFHKVYAYDGCDATDPWKLYDPSDLSGSDLAAITVEQGLLIDATAAVSLPSDGTLPDSTTLTLCTGWNLIGFPSGHPRHVKSALAPILDKVVRVFAFDPFDLADNWKFYEASAPAWASDLDLMEPGKGYWILVSEDVSLDIKNVGDAPSIAFTSPQDLDVITAPTEIQGTVASDLLESWQLRFRGVGENEWIELANGNFPVEGRLSEFDPTLLLNGMYELELVATDLQGLQVTDSIAVVVEGNMKIGHFTLSFVDLAIPLSGLDIEVVRTYDSRQRHLQGDFGYGWSLDIRQGSYINNRPPGDGWEIRATEGPWGLPCSPNAVLETKSHLTTIRLSDQEVYRFRLTVKDPGTIIGGCIGRAEFEFVDGPVPGATLDILGNDDVLYQNNSDELRDPDSFALFVPEDVKLTTRDGRIFHLDLTDGVTHLEDLNGNTLDITPEGITHSSGRGVEFERDAEGRIERIVDPMGNANVYAYDDEGDHVTFTDRIGAATQFVYSDGHYLEDIVNALGVRAVRTEFDDEGRMVRMIDAAGRPLTFDRDLDGRREVFTNRLGELRVMEYDGRGNLVREVDEQGAVTLRSFDAKDRLLSETDPFGNTTTQTYNATGDLTEITDPLGNATRFAYDNRGNPTTITDPRGGVTTSVFDSQGNQISVTDALGAVTSFVYDSRGMPLSVTDPLGNTRSTVYDATGQPVTVVDPLGVTTITSYDANGNPTSRSSQQTLANGSVRSLVTTFDVDALGRIVSLTDPSGATTLSTFDALGNILTNTDSLGRTTSVSYGSLGLQTARTYADGTGEVFGYDGEGRLSTVIDRVGGTTRFLYDSGGRLIETQYPDGTSRRSGYNTAGHQVSDTDALGHTTSYAYDAAGRQTSTSDALGHTTVSVYDALGNLTSITDALGNTTTFVFDAVGRLLQTNLPDGGKTRTEYDFLGRPIAEIDAAGVRTEFSYDAAGRLIEVLDALAGRTRYRHDEQGNRVEQIDALGRTTRTEVDAVGRLIRRVLPGGAAESFVYDNVGNLVAHTDLGSSTTTLAYDSVNRLVERTSPDGTGVLFTYTASGQRATMTDARGVTTFTYEGRDRLASVTSPDGWALHNRWDAEDRRTALTLDLGDPAAGGFGVLTTTYAHDALGRLASVTDAYGGASTYSYDALGREVSLIQPNGVTSSRSYNANGQLLAVDTMAPSGAVVQSYTYTLGPTGNRQSVVEADGTRRYWTYDGLFRLSTERVTDNASALIYEHRFSYDAVGNRLTRERLDGAGGVELVSSLYDDRDRLLSETQNGTTSTYSWDINGNLASEAGSEGTTTYGWDAEDRLVSAVLPDGTEVLNVYDGDGVWVGRTMQRAGESPQSRQLLTDTTESLSQVLAEIEEGALTTQYVRGKRLLSILGDGTEHAVHRDGLGSVRALTDQGGALTDRYDYAGFGGLVSRTGQGANPFRFAGEYFDSELGLAHHRARWLNSSQGRFLSRDPWTSRPRRPTSNHRYLYAEDDPVNRVDPSGLISLPSLSLGLAIGGIVASIGFIYFANIPSRTAFTIPVRLRPIVATKSKWTDAEIQFKLLEARSILARNSTLALTWGPIERKTSIDPLLRLGSGQEFVELLEPLSKENQGLPVVFLSSFYDPMAVLGVGGGDVVGSTWRGLVMSRRALNNGYTLSHELGHAIGFLDHQVLPGVPGPSAWQPFDLPSVITGCPLGSPYLMAPGGLCFFRGSKFTDSERQQLRINAFSLR